MVRVPVPELPTYNTLELVHVDPAPVTVAVPVETAVLPIYPAVFVTVPLFVMLKEPVPELPTYSSAEFVHVDPAPVTVAVPVESAA